MVDCPDRPCPVCKGPMAEQKESACSGRCRAALSRRKRAEAQEERERQAVDRALADRDQRLQRLVETLAREVGFRVEDME